MTRKRKNRARRRPRRGGRLVRLLLTSVVACALVMVGWLLLAYPRQAPAGDRRSFSFEMPGDVPALTAELERLEVVDSALVFGAYLRLMRAEDGLRDGTVLLARGLRPDEVLRRISRGRGPVPRRVTIPEGFTRFDVARRLEELEVCSAADFLAVTEQAPEGVAAPSAEGYLFPDTYEFDEGTAPETVVRRMVEAWHMRVDPLLEEHSERVRALGDGELRFSRHDILNLASVVEREAVAAVERPTIAGVFLNRLRSDTFRPRHRLQADPTVSYGCIARPLDAESCAGFEGQITRAMLEDSDNTYNSYRHAGLPPGPVCNPGLDAIEAVLTAGDHDYLYFVARGGGRHAFSADLETHHANVRRYQ